MELEPPQPRSFMVCCRGSGQRFSSIIFDLFDIEYTGYGANVVIADLAEQSGKALAATFGKLVDVQDFESTVQTQRKCRTALFQKTDVTSWQSLLDLFQVTFETFGSVDHVCANAGVPEQGNFLLEDKYDSEGKLAEPSFRLLDVNVNGVLRSK